MKISDKCIAIQKELGHVTPKRISEDNYIITLFISRHIHYYSKLCSPGPEKRNGGEGGACTVCRSGGSLGAGPGNRPGAKALEIPANPV